MLQARPAVAAHNSDPKDRSLEEHQLRQIIDLIPQHIVIIEPGGSSAYTNHISREYFGRHCDLAHGAKRIHGEGHTSGRPRKINQGGP